MSNGLHWTTEVEENMSYRKEMSLTHIEFYTGSTYISSYLTTSLPRITSKYNADYVWIPMWLWHVERYVYSLFGKPTAGSYIEGILNVKVAPTLQCLLHIYNDKDLNAKYSSLHALDQTYDLEDELRKDLKGIQCQTINCSITE